MAGWGGWWRMGGKELSEIYLQIDQSHSLTNTKVPQPLLSELKIAFNFYYCTSLKAPHIQRLKV